MKRGKELKLSCIDVSENLKNYEIINFKINYQNEICILGKDNQLSEIEIPVNYKIIIIGKNGIREVSIKNIDFYVSHFDLLPNDEIILAFARTRKDEKGNYFKNLKIYKTDGSFQREFLIGDGIEDLQTTSNGEIWTTYFDEGIYGNRDLRDLLGRPGLLCWNIFGEKLYEFEYPIELGWMADCYALNVRNNNEIWISYYCHDYPEEWPIVMVNGKEKINYWINYIYGFNYFSIFENFILTSNSFNSKSFYLIELLEDNKSEFKELIFFFNDGNKCLNELENRMRKDLICFRENNKFYITNLREVLK